MTNHAERETGEADSEPIVPSIDLTEFSPSVNSINFTTHKLVDGHIIPTAQGVFRQDELAYMVIDTEALASDIAGGVTPESIQEYVETIVPVLDIAGKVTPKLMAEIMAVNAALGKRGLGNNPNRNRLRSTYYKAKHARSISDVVEKQCGKCTEISVVAQQVFQACGIKSKYISGGMADIGSDYLAGHGYILLEDEEGQVIYDPYNSFSWNSQGETVFSPMVYAVEGDFIDQLRDGTRLAARVHGITVQGDRMYGLQGEIGLPQGQR